MRRNSAEIAMRVKDCFESCCRFVFALTNLEDPRLLRPVRKRRRRRSSKMTALWPGMQQTPHLHGHLMPLLCPCQAARHSCLIERRRKSPDDSIVIDLKEHFVATI